MQTTEAQNKYATCLTATPVLHTGDFESVFGGTDGKTVRTDKEGLIRDLEYIAFKGTVFEILEEIDKGDHKIYKVRTDNYDYNTSLYIDSRFVNISNEKPKMNAVKLPSKDEIYDFLDKAVGSKYCWGGNYIKGIDKMLTYYKPSGNISQDMKDLWTLKGCDCSGLMYEATNGYSERNTSKLINYGQPVNIEGLNAEQIIDKLELLDMIVWNGHVIYVYDKHTAIQSSLSKGGVVKTELLETIENIMKKRKPVNDYDSSSGERFVVRRWYDTK
jgi:hypothetical protein